MPTNKPLQLIRYLPWCTDAHVRWCTIGHRQLHSEVLRFFPRLFSRRRTPLMPSDRGGWNMNPSHTSQNSTGLLSAVKHATWYQIALYRSGVPKTNMGR